MKLSHVALLVLLAPAMLFAQESRATISGAVTDATGATVGGTQITATETRTGTKTRTTSDAAGQYTLLFLGARYL